MFTIDKYKFTFKHVDLREEKEGLAEELGGSHATFCFVLGQVDESEYRMIGMGVSLCSLEDNFCKATGRKISLTRALFEAGFDREFRTEIWKKYWSIVK